jgi:hypothetical protein
VRYFLLAYTYAHMGNFVQSHPGNWPGVLDRTTTQQRSVTRARARVCVCAPAALLQCRRNAQILQLTSGVCLRLVSNAD